MLESLVSFLCLFWSKWLPGETGDGRERERERETRHNRSPPTKKLRLRLDWGRGGMVEVGVGWGSAISLTAITVVRNIVFLILKLL